MYDGAPAHSSRAVLDVAPTAMAVSMMRSVEASTESHGGYFKHLL
jgi:hypothetical protein